LAAASRGREQVDSLYSDKEVAELSTNRRLQVILCSGSGIRLEPAQELGFQCQSPLPALEDDDAAAAKADWGPRRVAPDRSQDVPLASGAAFVQDVEIDSYLCSPLRWRSLHERPRI